jgi:hypothetical protein
MRQIVGISIYLIAFCSACLSGFVFIMLDYLPKEASFMKVALMSCCIAGAAGCLYCIRAVYLNKCVHKRWDQDWNIWYVLRPLTSILSGGASYLFLKAGLLILESKQETSSSDIGFLALAFIAGFNVDKFLAKIESIAEAVWGIEKSRSSNTTGKGES